MIISKPTVALIHCPDYDEIKIAAAICKQFSLLGGIEKYIKRGDKVLLKPNMIAPRPRQCATQTDPEIIIQTAKILKDFGAKPFVGDSPAWSSVYACAKALELDEPLKKMDVPLVQLDNPVEKYIAGIDIGISKYALDADVIINLPKFKSHQQLVATFAVKNMFGCVSGKWKAYWHFKKGGSEKKFCKMLIEIYKFLNPALTIIDGITIMDGPGPIRGRPRPLGYLIGGTEPISCEVVCSKLINLNPETLPIVRTAKEINFGCRDYENISISGDTPINTCNDFVPAVPIPIRFSFLHLCKSICKQAILLIKSRLK